MKSLKNQLTSLIVLVSLILLTNRSYAHCEIPCGIYEDSVRITLIKEHITTIEKSMNKINEISKEAEPNYNQLVRWINNKEEHAIKIQEIVSQYFLHQRVKLTDPADKEKYEKYVKQLTLLHEMLVYAMKTKQTTDLSYIEKLRSTVMIFEKKYFLPHGH